MHINNRKLNDIIVDRFYKPKWIRKPLIGYAMIAFGKYKVQRRKRLYGNDTFAEDAWAEIFYGQFRKDIVKDTQFFNYKNLMENKPYEDNNAFRYNRHISLKLWLQYIGII